MSTLFPLLRVYIKLILDVFINFDQFIYLFIFPGLNNPFLCDLWFFDLFHILNKSDNNNNNTKRSRTLPESAR